MDQVAAPLTRITPPAPQFFIDSWRNQKKPSWKSFFTPDPILIYLDPGHLMLEVDVSNTKFRTILPQWSFSGQLLHPCAFFYFFSFIVNSGSRHTCNQIQFASIHYHCCMLQLLKSGPLALTRFTWQKCKNWQKEEQMSICIDIYVPVKRFFQVCLRLRIIVA